VKSDYRRAEVSGADRAMLDFAARLTLEPAAVRAADVARLRDQGFDDGAIHDVVQVTALFAYYNRLADGLGVDPEPRP
jgi:uncharacterized peroxidase-related enzyme